MLLLRSFLYNSSIDQTDFGRLGFVDDPLLALPTFCATAVDQQGILEGTLWFDFQAASLGHVECSMWLVAHVVEAGVTYVNWIMYIAACAIEMVLLNGQDLEARIVLTQVLHRLVEPSVRRRPVRMRLLIGILRNCRGNDDIIIASTNEIGMLRLVRGCRRRRWVGGLFILEFDVYLFQNAGALKSSDRRHSLVRNSARIDALEVWRVDFSGLLMRSKTERSDVGRRHRVGVDHCWIVCKSEMELLVELFVVDGWLGRHGVAYARQAFVVDLDWLAPLWANDRFDGCVSRASTKWMSTAKPVLEVWVLDHVA